MLFAVARWVAKLKFLVGNTESIFLSLSLGCIHTASVCCRRVLALSLPLSTQHHSHSCRFAGTKRSSRLPLGCSRYRGPAVVLRVLLWLHIVHLLASHFAPLSFPARENARNLHACIHIRTPVCTALLHRLFFCPRLLCVRPCYRSRWTCAWKMLMRVSWLTKPDRAACFSFSPLHTHARTHAHTHARAHTHAHTHTHSSSHFAVFVPFSLHAFLSIKPGNPSSMLTPSSTLSTHTTDEMQSAKQRQAELDVLAADLPDTEPHRTLCLVNNCKGLLLTISHLLQ